jgi:hypothetical protein
MQVERDELAAKVKELQSKSRDPRKEWLDKFRQEFFTFGHVVTTADEDHGTLDLTGYDHIRLVLDVPPTVLREKLLRPDMRVYVWFRPKGRGAATTWRSCGSPPN